MSAPEQEARTGWGRTTKTSQQGDGQVICDKAPPFDGCGKRVTISLAWAAKTGRFPICHGQVMRLMDEGELARFRTGASQKIRPADLEEQLEEDAAVEFVEEVEQLGEERPPHVTGDLAADAMWRAEEAARTGRLEAPARRILRALEGEERAPARKREGRRRNAERDAEIIRRYEAGVKARDNAAAAGVSEAAIYCVIHRHLRERGASAKHGPRKHLVARNEDIVRRVGLGEDVALLADEYRISTTRVYQIVGGIRS